MSKPAQGRFFMTNPTEREIRIERIFHAPRARVWRAMTEPDQVAQWWGRGNKLVIERLDVKRGGRWRFVEHATDGHQVFEGRYREVTPPVRMVQTFEWEGMPGHVVIETITLESLGDHQTRVVTESLFHTPEERDGTLSSGMEEGLKQSYAALDKLLEQPVEDSRPWVLSRQVRKVAFTMYPVTDVARARGFYENMLGLEVGVAGGQGDIHWIEYDLPGGGCLALTNASQEEPSAAAGGTIALEVEDLSRLMKDLKTRGVTFKSDVIRGPRCRMAVCLDSEGNSVLLHQVDHAIVV